MPFLFILYTKKTVRAAICPLTENYKQHHTTYKARRFLFPVCRI